MAGYIDCNNDKLMVLEGLRPPILLINKEVFKKSMFEKGQLKLVRFKKKYAPIVKTKSSFKMIRLTIHIKNGKGLNHFKNTYSFIIKERDINTYLNKFKDRVVKYNISNIY